MSKRKAGSTHPLLDEADLYWKRTEVALKETQGALQKVIFNLHTLENLTQPRLTFHLVAAQVLGDPFRRAVATTATLLEVVAEAVAKALDTARETEPAVARARAAKGRADDPFDMYRLHTFLNAQMFQAMGLVTEAFGVLCREGAGVWAAAEQREYKKLARKVGRGD